MPQLIERFITDGSLQKLDPACLKPLRRPPFFVSFAGPPP